MSALGNPTHVPPPLPPGPVPVAKEPHQPGSNRWIWHLASLVMIGGVTSWFFLGRPNGEKTDRTGALSSIKTVVVANGDLLQTVRVSGLTASRSFVNVTAPILRGPDGGQMVLLFLVQSGARVKKGDVVAQIDSKTLEDRIDDIGDEIEQADSDVRKRQAEQAVDLENLNQSIRNAKSAYDKAVLEAKAGEVRTEVEQELLKLTVEENAARYKQVQADTKFKLAGYSAEVKILEITKARLIRRRGRQRTDLARFKMVAPMDGLAVVQPMFRGGEMSVIQQGDQVMAGQLFMKVVDPAKMVIEGNVNQSESGAFQLGQKADIRFDAYPAMKLQGQVDSIAALANKGPRENFYIRNLPVRVDIKGSDPKLIPDLSASVDVVIARVNNVALVPLGAVHSEGGKEIVYVRAAKGGFDKRTITIGERNNTHIAVKSGLEAGEEVAIELPAQTPVAVASL